MVQDILSGVRNFFKAIGFLLSNGLWWYYFFPLIVSVLLFIGSWMATVWIVDWVQVLGQEYLGLEVDPSVKDGFDGFWESTKGFFNDARDFILAGAIWVIKLTVFYYAGKYIVLIVLSPVMAYLSERTEEILTGQEYPFDLMQFTREVWRGVLIAVRNMFIEFGIIIVAWIITFFLPFLSPFTAVFLFFVGAYYYGFSMMDYVNERKRLKISESVQYIRRNKGVAIGNGSIFALFMWVPFFGFIIAPITASVGAVLAIHEKNELGSQYSRPKHTAVQPPVN